MTNFAISEDGDTIEMTRGQAVFADDSTGRYYEDVDTGNRFASVTTHLSRMDTPKKETRLNSWKKRNRWLVTADWIDAMDADTEMALDKEEARELLLDEEKDLDAVWLDGELVTNKANYWSSYTAARGTVAHCDLLEFLSGEKIWGDEEDEAMETLKQMDDVVGLQENYDIGGWQSGLSSCEEEIDWIVENATDHFDDIQEVLLVEQYLVNNELGYAGQVDLIYLSEDGEIVVADLKTGLDFYYQYRTQLTAYWQALPMGEIREKVSEISEFDGEDCEVTLKNVRSNWENKETEEQTDSDWREPLDVLIDWLIDVTERNNSSMFPIQSVTS